MASLEEADERRINNYSSDQVQSTHFPLYSSLVWVTASLKPNQMTTIHKSKAKRSTRKVTQTIIKAHNLLTPQSDHPSPLPAPHPHHHNHLSKIRSYLNSLCKLSTVKIKWTSEGKGIQQARMYTLLYRPVLSM